MRVRYGEVEKGRVIATKRRGAMCVFVCVCVCVCVRERERERKRERERDRDRDRETETETEKTRSYLVGALSPVNHKGVHQG